MKTVYELLDEFEHECFMLRVEASETRAKDKVVREAYERIREESAQAIAATLGGGECEFVIEDNMNESEGMGDVWFRCTNCDTTFDYYADDWLMKQNYCPHCGFKIRKAVGE